ncbi:MAG TPA: ATP-grasp domain-containing protein [Vicinamibacterales bacterium]|nr:ATP-grasp domain-containing protein [Vicinamibacterales bacterium]
MPRVLLLSTTTGYQLRSFSEAAERLGIELALATDRCHLLDDPWQDQAIPVRFFDDEESLEAISRAAHERPFSGVIAVGDRPAVLAARVTQLLRLSGNPPEAAEATGNKKLMRRKFAAAGLPVPWWLELPATAEAHDVAARVRYPCVVKPLGLSGSRGVIRADTPRQLEYAVARVRALLARPAVRAHRRGLEMELLIEGYIEGREYAIEALLTRGELRVLAIFDKPDPLEGPFFEETIYVTPIDVPWQVQHAMAEQLQRATAALGLVHGPIHAECRVGSAGVVMLEVASRPIGGLCSKMLRFTAGSEHASLEEVLLRHATGEDVSPYMREEPASGVMMIPIPKRGLFKGVMGEDGARAAAHVEEVHITAKVDQLLEPLPEGDSYLGFIFAHAGQAADVVAALRESHRRLHFHITPDIAVETQNTEHRT